MPPTRIRYRADYPRLFTNNLDIIQPEQWTATVNFSIYSLRLENFNKQLRK